MEGEGHPWEEGQVTLHIGKHSFLSSSTFTYDIPGFLLSVGEV